MPGALARRGVVPVLALLLVGTTASGAPLTGPTAPAAASAPDCSEPADTDGAAAELAVACKKDVEVVGERTSWQTVYAQPNGNMRLEISTAAVRTQEDGKWVPVDSSVVESTDGLVVAAAVSPMTFSDGTDGAPLATLERDGHTLTFDVPFDLPQPVVHDDQVVYEDVLPDVDLVVTVTPDATGFTEVLRVETPEAAADPRLDTLRFPIEASKDLDIHQNGGGFEALDSSGEAVFSSPPPTMWDSATPPTASPLLRTTPLQRLADESAVLREAEAAGVKVDRAVAPIGAETVATMPIAVSDTEVSVSPVDSLLTDPDTVWPVYIDPGVSASLQQYAAVRTEWGTKTGWTDEGVGLCNDSSCSKVFRSRLLWRFVGLDAIGALDRSNIIRATFAAVGTHSYNCTAQPVTLYRVNDFNSSTVGWDGGFLVAQSTVTVAHKDKCAGQPVRWIEFDATESAQAVADVNAGVLALGLAANESSMAYWKRYRWDAGYSVEYNRAPNPPAGLRTDNPSTACVVGASRPYIRSLTPTLVATLSDPDGNSVYGQFDVIDAATGGAVWAVNSAAQGSGAEHKVTVSPNVLKDGHTYQWRVLPVDAQYGLGSSQGACEFTVDSTLPVPPTVTPVAGQPAVYEKNTAAGGLGLTGQFTLSPGTSSDIVSYKYSFDTDAVNQTANVALGGSATIAYNPTVAGAHTLYVKSVDRAGNTTQDATVHPFIVKFPGVWRLDEGDGTSASGAGTSGSRFPLTVSSSTTWVPGMLTETGFSTTDKALKFDAASDVAQTSGPVVPTNVQYSVMAFVKADGTGNATAVSQDGTNISQFELGTVNDSACATDNDICWAFSVAKTDASSSEVLRALSTVPVETGQWYHVAGIRSSDTIQVSVCRVGSVATLETNPTPVLSDSVSLPSTFYAAGALKLGRGLAGGNAAHAWLGTVDNVQVMDGPASIAQLRSSCAAVE